MAEREISQINEFSSVEDVKFLEIWSHFNARPINIEVFKSETIDGKAFLSLKEDDLKELGLNMGDRKHLITEINALNRPLVAFSSNDGSFVISESSEKLESFETFSESLLTETEVSFEFSVNYLQNLLLMSVDGKAIMDQYNALNVVSDNSIKKLIQICVGKLAEATQM